MRRTRVVGIVLVILFLLVFANTFVSASNEQRADSQTSEVVSEGSIIFRVRIQNIAAESETPTLFAPGAWVLHSEANPIFTSGEEDRGEGLEALAEDGDPTLLANSLRAQGLQSGVFSTPVCADSPRTLRPLEYFEFEVTASPETPLLSFATMLAQSNDFFLAPARGGIPLFDDENMPIAAQFVTKELLLWDAGTEKDEVVGEGANQAPRQASTNTGPEDQNASVRPADVEPDFPTVVETVRVYIVQVPLVERNSESLQIQNSDFSIGEEFQVGDVVWHVLSAENLGHEIKAQSDRRTTSERFIKVRFQFLNVGSDPLEFEAVEDLPLRDREGREYVHYRIPSLLGEEYPKDFINDDEACFGRRVLGVWRPFVLKPNAPTTCETIFEANIDATELVLLLSGLQKKEDDSRRSVELKIPATSRIAIGKELQVGDIRWEVLSAEDHGHVVEGNGFREKTTERFIEVRFEITNKGSASLDFPGAVLRDRQGREYERKSSDVIPEDEKCVGGIVGEHKLRPNTITNCTSIYEIPNDSTGLVFVADDLHGNEAGTEIVGLGLSDLEPISLYLIDESVKVGHMCWKVRSVEDLGQDLRNQEGDSETTEGRFVSVQFELLNLGAEPLEYEGLILEDRRGRRYSHFGERLEFIDDEHECPPSLLPPRSYLVKPNTPTICTTIYEVPTESEVFILIASDLEGYETVPIIFTSVAAVTPPEPYGPGTYEVGKEIAPGVYRGEAVEDSYCNWSRLTELNGDPEDIIAMGQREGQFYVEIQDKDVGFITECDLVPLEALEPREPLLTAVPPGMYIVGLDIDPGKYEGSPDEDLFCFWQRMKDFREEESSTIEWDLPGEKFEVEVLPTDFAVEFHCPVQMVN